LLAVTRAVQSHGRPKQHKIKKGSELPALFGDNFGDNFWDDFGDDFGVDFGLTFWDNLKDDFGPIKRTILVQF
jgi:hypothetical protein